MIKKITAIIFLLLCISSNIFANIDEEESAKLHLINQKNKFLLYHGDNNYKLLSTINNLVKKAVHERTNIEKKIQNSKLNREQKKEVQEIILEIDNSLHEIRKETKMIKVTRNNKEGKIDIEGNTDNFLKNYSKVIMGTIKINKIVNSKKK